MLANSRIAGKRGHSMAFALAGAIGIFAPAPAQAETPTPSGGSDTAETTALTMMTSAPGIA